MTNSNPQSQPNTTPMRQIKFRVYNCTRNEMTYDLESIDISDGVITQVNTAQDRILFPDKECELMQYTGLKDKNGVEIYEGDIVRQKTGRAYTEDRVVRFDAGAFRFQNQLTKHGCYIYTNQNTEVIGNIYKNKDLL